MDIVLAIIGLVVFTIIAYKKIDWGLYAVIVMLPSYLFRFHLMEIPFTFLEGMILILFVRWILMLKKEKRVKNYFCDLRKNKFFIPVVLFLSAATISVIIAPDIRAALGYWKAYFIEPILFLLVFLDVVKTKKHIVTIIKLLLVLLFLLSGFAAIQGYSDWMIPEQYQDELRVTSIYQYPAALGLITVPISILLFGVMMFKYKILSEFEVAVIITVLMLNLLALFYAQTEGAIIGLAVGCFFVLMFSRYRHMVALVAIMLIILVLMFPFSRGYLVEKITLSDVSGDVRTVMWQGTVEMIKANPVLGVGLGGFEREYINFKEDKHVEILVYPHNVVMNFWTETGTLGLFAFGWIMVISFKKLFNLFRSGKLKMVNWDEAVFVSILGSFVGLLVYGIVDVPYFKNDLSVEFWLFIGLLIVSWNHLYKKHGDRITGKNLRNWRTD